jgi:MFS family permease
MRGDIFKASLPVTGPSFVNRLGDVGIRFFPMLLVEMQVSNDKASLATGFVKAMSMLAILVGGFVSDHSGYRVAILLSFLLSALGMFWLPFSETLLVITLASGLASFGQGLFHAPARLALASIAPQGARSEVLAWFRTLNNGGIFAANAVSSVLAQFGLKALFIFDALTSLIAFFVGVFVIPKRAPQSDLQPSMVMSAKGSSIAYFGLVVFLTAMFSFGTEIFFVASAARAKIDFGVRGPVVYSYIYMINTGLCMVFSVWIAKRMKSVLVSAVSGMTLLAASLLVFFWMTPSLYSYIGSCLLQTLGEMIFLAVSIDLMMRSVPASKHHGKIYSIGLQIQAAGKILGAMLAWQMLESLTLSLFIILVFAITSMAVAWVVGAKVAA